jgi:hypothetical protein
VAQTLRALPISPASYLDQFPVIAPEINLSPNSSTPLLVFIISALSFSGLSTTEFTHHRGVSPNLVPSMY